MGNKQSEHQSISDAILAAIEPDTWYFTGDIAALLGRPPMSIVEPMKQMRHKGLLEISQSKGKTIFRMKPQREVAGPRYVAPHKPLTGYDPGALMRLCNAGRNDITGLA